MKPSELREKSDEDLRAELEGSKRELFNLRFQWQTEEAANPAQYATLYDAESGAPLAIGRVALATRPGHPDEPAQWAGLAAIETAPDARRRGLAKLVIDMLLEWAADQGATDAFLEVFKDNAPALALYESIGFRTDHAYHFRIIDQPTV